MEAELVSKGGPWSSIQAAIWIDVGKTVPFMWNPRLWLSPWCSQSALVPWAWSISLGKGKGNEAMWAEPLQSPPQILADGWSKILALCAVWLTRSLLFQRVGPRKMMFPKIAAWALSMRLGGTAGIIILHIVRLA